MDDVRDEPVFQDVSAPEASSPAGVWGEPVLAEADAALAANAAHRAWLVRQWAEARSGTHGGLFALLCVVVGPLAIVCTLLKGEFGLGIIAVVLGAPFVEEVAKSLAPLMVLEKKPWLFSSAFSIVMTGFLSGAVFATIENLLYFFLYIPAGKLTPFLILWRLIACSMLHIGCSTLACYGLSRAWKKAFVDRCEFDVVPAIPWLTAAIVIHGTYNLGAVLFSLCQTFSANLV